MTVLVGVSGRGQGLGWIGISGRGQGLDWGYLVGQGFCWGYLVGDRGWIGGFW